MINPHQTSGISVLFFFRDLLLFSWSGFSYYFLVKYLPQYRQSFALVGRVYEPGLPQRRYPIGIQEFNYSLLQ